jgi:hypothetical protein
MSYPIWNLSTKATSSGNCIHVGGVQWSVSQSDSFSINYIDSTNTVQTIWFRNLGNLLRTSPVVYLIVSSNQGIQPNSATYLVTGLTQNNTVYTINVRYQSSTQIEIGSPTAALSFNYYSSVN